MNIKRLLLVFTLLVFIMSCSPYDDPRDNYPQRHDITFLVTSSDENRLSDITFTIQGNGIDVSTFSSSDSHLPLAEDYFNQKIPYFTSLGISYRDNSGGEVGVPFESYDIRLIIKVDAETRAEKEVTITESGFTDFLIFTFD